MGANEIEDADGVGVVGDVVDSDDEVEVGAGAGVDADADLDVADGDDDVDASDVAVDDDGAPEQGSWQFRWPIHRLINYIMGMPIHRVVKVGCPASPSHRIPTVHKLR